jgi:hypothetical protein
MSSTIPRNTTKKQLNSTGINKNFVLLLENLHLGQVEFYLKALDNNVKLTNETPVLGYYSVKERIMVTKHRKRCLNQVLLTKKSCT